MRYYAFVSDESLFTWLLFDVIIMVVDYYSSLTYKHLVLEIDLKTGVLK